MKKLAVLLCLCLFLFSLIGCASDDSYRVYLITMDNLDEFWVNVDAGCRKAVMEENQIGYTWISPLEKSIDGQISCIQQAINNEADAIILAASDETALNEVLQQAAAHNIALVYVDSAADFPAVQHVGTDNYDAGRKAGREMQQALEDQGITDGFIGVISTSAHTDSTGKRDAGFRDSFADTDFTILDTRYCEGVPAVAETLAQDLLSVGCVGIFSTNEGCTLGLGRAINGEHPSALAIGFDRSAEIEAEILDGSLHCVLVQSPDVMGYSGMKAALAALKGKSPGSKTVDTGVRILYAADLESGQS